MEEKIRIYCENIKNELVTLRKSYRFTQKDVAKQLGITHQSYQAYESGLTVPTLQNFLKLCLVFDVSPNELLGMK